MSAAEAEVLGAARTGDRAAFDALVAPFRRESDLPVNPARDVRAWEEADVPGLVALLHEDAVLSMPPMSGWVQGPRSMGAAIGGMVLPKEARGVFRLVPIEANGEAGFAMYAKAPGGVYWAQAIHVVRTSRAKVAEVTAFIDATLFPAFGLGDTLA